MSYTLPQRNHSQPHVTPPEALSAMHSRLPSHGAVSTLRTGSGALVQAYTDVAATKGRIERDRTLNDAAKLVRLASYTKTKLDGAFKEYRTAEIATLEARAHLFGRINAPFDMRRGLDGAPRSFAEVLAAQEIRAHFASLPRTERLNTLQRAIDAYDEETLIAVCAARPYLSGLEEALWHVARYKVINQRSAAEAEAYEAVKQGQEIAEAMERAMLQSVSNMVDFATADEYARSAVA